MKLLTKELTDKLLANGRKREEDHIPVVKFFSPYSGATWLFTELDEDGDTLFGLCDLGMGEPELGNVSLNELASVKFRGMVPAVERDKFWKGNHPLSVYTEKARQERHIVDSIP